MLLFQFGPEKDVYGPRFAKNITLTFQHIFRCSAEEQVITLYHIYVSFGEPSICVFRPQCLEQSKHKFKHKENEKD